MNAPASDVRGALFALEHIGIKLGLEQIRALVAALGAPDRTFRSIVIAGTNGKGSVAAMTERALRAAGYRTGRYTSPHLVHLEERFAIDGEAVSPPALDRSAARVLDAGKALPYPPTFFEATTAIALDLFREAAVDVAVLEVGLGGRLDATNVVTPVAVAITALDFDHEQYLGHTLAAIAAEKAGVVKAGADVVVSQHPDEARAVIRRRCAEVGARLIEAAEGTAWTARTERGQTTIDLTTPVRRYEGVRLALRGAHQIGNAVTAVRLLEVLDAGGASLDVGDGHIRAGLEEVVWHARLELIRYQGRELLIDGAHNPSGARALGAYLASAYGQPVPMVVGIMRDKNVDAMIDAFGAHASRFVFTAPDTPRAASPGELLAARDRVRPGVPAEVAADPADALGRVLAGPETGVPAVVAGSLFLAGEIRARVA